MNKLTIQPQNVVDRVAAGLTPPTVMSTTLPSEGEVKPSPVGYFLEYVNTSGEIVVEQFHSPELRATFMKESQVALNRPKMFELPVETEAPAA